MPRIGKDIYLICGEHIAVETYYSRKKGFYPKGLPAEVATFCDRRLSGFSNESALDDAIREALHKYHSFKKQARKVIAFHVILSTPLGMVKDGPGSYCGHKGWVPDNMKRGSLRGESGLTDVDGYGFLISWQILFEEKAAKVNYYDVCEDGTKGFKEHIGHRQVIDWTPEREASFKEIDNSLEEMVKKIAAVFGNEKKILGMLDSGVKLLT